MFNRLGVVEKRDRDLVIYKARALNPDYPGIVDYPCWYVGKNYCHERRPNCGECPFGACAAEEFKWACQKGLGTFGCCKTFKDATKGKE